MTLYEPPPPLCWFSVGTIAHRRGTPPEDWFVVTGLMLYVDDVEGWMVRGLTPRGPERVGDWELEAHPAPELLGEAALAASAIAMLKGARM